MWNDYYVPATLDEALQLLAQHAPDARLIAGGTDLVIELDLGVRKVKTLIDVSLIPGQDNIHLDDANRIHLGPLVTHSQVVGSALCVEQAYPLARACREVGAPQIRNRGTVAGNLITASPANDTITPLMALHARITLRSVRGAREVPLADFYTGVRRTVMAADEMLVDISFPAMQPNQRGTFIKLGLRRAQAVSVINCAVALNLKPSGIVEQATITLGAVAPVIVRATQAEAALIGKPLSDETIVSAAQLAQNVCRPIDDIRSTANYRRRMAAVVTQRALAQLLQGEPRSDWNDAPALLWGAIPPPLKLTAAENTSDYANHTIHLRVNGRDYVVEGASDKTLLRLLREDCLLVGTKEGCAEGECGACTVIMDGKAVMACLVPAPRAHGSVITTIEGLAHDGHLHALQQAFIDQGAVQCGYCTPGFIMSGAALLEEHPHPNDAQIKESISGNLCRCTGYYKIVSAFKQAGETIEPKVTNKA